MNSNEIKKLLYQEKVMANFIEEVDDSFVYHAVVSIGTVVFRIPVNEGIGDDGNRVIEDQIKAQLLNRWISKVE